MAFGSVHIPVGCTVKIGDTVAGLIDLGVLKGDSTIAISYDEQRAEGSKAEVLVDYIKNMKAEASFTLYQLFMANVQKLLDGAATVTSQAAAPVNAHQQLLPSGSWNYQKFIPFDGQNSSGAVPTNITVVAATDGACVVNTDYFLLKDVNGIWGLYIIDSARLTTESQLVTLQFDYTPAASKTLVMGAPSAALVAKIVEFSKTINGKVFRARLWSAVNKNGITISFPDASDGEPASIPVSLEGGLDTTKASGAQLIEIYDEIGLSL